MILSKTVKVKVLNTLVSHYFERGYTGAKHNQWLEVKVEDLSHGSNVEILCNCEKCRNDFTVKFRLLVLKNGQTVCKKCRLSESARERIKKYGSNWSNPETQRKISTKYKGNPEKLKEIDSKRKTTKLVLHGSENWNNQEKRLETVKEKGKNWNNSSQRKITCFLKHGSENWNNQEKKRKTCVLKYGVEHPQQLTEIFSKTCKHQKFRDTNILYQGSYELDFLEKFYDKFEIRRGLRFDYEIDGVQKKYFSDFYVPSLNLIVEVKSMFTFLQNKKINELKQRAVETSKYDFIWIIDKNYDEFLKKYADSAASLF